MKTYARSLRCSNMKDLNGATGSIYRIGVRNLKGLALIISYTIKRPLGTMSDPVVHREVSPVLPLVK